MKISYNWLKTLIDLSEPPAEVARLLTQSGLEVGSIQEKNIIQGGLAGLVLGKVLTCEKHPNADRLQYTQVDIGQDTPLHIVCGAPNVKAGQKVIVAPVGTTLYPTTGNNFTIKKTKIRGLVSEGMICAATEIGLPDNQQAIELADEQKGIGLLADDQEKIGLPTGQQAIPTDDQQKMDLAADQNGILVLNTDLPPGTPASACFNLPQDTILDIELTPNRADACSHWGVARDLHALLTRPMHKPEVRPIPELSPQLAPNNIPKLPIQVQIEDHAACPRYAGVTVYGLSIAPSPMWLQQSLQAIDIQPINNIVDITNFVMHELGQPLHAFDYDQLVGPNLQIKKSNQEQSIVTLDGVDRKLTGEEWIISDQKGAVALAGILGGKRARVSEKTKNIFLESAYFHPKAVSKTTQAQQLKTEASFRYEKGTDPNMPVYALQRALFLIQQVNPQATFSEVLDVYPQPIAHRKIAVYYANITKLIGQAIPKATIHTILNHLAIGLEAEQEDCFIAVVPPYRVDVTREVDIIEEITRIYGYDRINIADHLGSAFLAPPSQVDHAYQKTYALSLLLTASGYHEIYTNSLTSSHYNKLTGASSHDAVPMLNPLSERLNQLKTHLVFAGLEGIAHNMNRQQKDLKFFEWGKTYHKLNNNQYIEQQKLGIWLTGNIEAPNWIRQPRAVTFQDLNAIVAQLLSKLGIQAYNTCALKDAIFEQGIQIDVDQKPLVQLGLLSKACLQTVGIKQPVFFAELDWEWIKDQPMARPKYQPISKFPIVKRDLSLVIDQSITFQQIKDIVHQQKEPLIRAIHVFDVYQGEHLEPGKKAYALSFALQGTVQTLEEKTIQHIMQRLMYAFEKELGAMIRT